VPYREHEPLLTRSLTPASALRVAAPALGLTAAMLPLSLAAPVQTLVATLPNLGRYAGLVRRGAFRGSGDLVLYADRLEVPRGDGGVDVFPLDGLRIDRTPQELVGRWRIPVVTFFSPDLERVLAEEVIDGSVDGLLGAVEAAMARLGA
jgi:hypothetical protein